MVNVIHLKKETWIVLSDTNLFVLMKTLFQLFSNLRLGGFHVEGRLVVTKTEPKNIRMGVIDG